MKNMEVWSLSHTSFFATSIHIDATSTQLSQTSNIHGFFGLLLTVHRYCCNKIHCNMEEQIKDQ